MKKVKIYTDGACSGNPGRGGFGVILEYNGRKKELSKGFRKTTNNRMELMAVITGLSALKEPCEVEVVSDSKYVVDAIVKEWVYTWADHDWIKSDKKPVLNVDLWEELLLLIEGHVVSFTWVEGHAGHPENERCDALAVAAAKGSDLAIDEEYEDDE